MNNSVRKIKILTENKYLYQKLFLEFSRDGGFCVTDADAELVLVDIDTCRATPGAILLSYSDSRADILLPARLGDIKKALLAEKPPPLSLIEEEKSALLLGEKIKLTELEFALLSLLYKRRDFVSREEILNAVWHGMADGGIINVYIHYLREKLEKGGEKIILSSRKSGYGINKKYLGEEENA